MNSPLPRLLLALCSLILSAAGAAPTLKVGDFAPKLQTGKWVQGEPVKEFETGKAYIVEFWATWCGPCRTSIPHLNEIAQKFQDKGLVVIGQDVWERDESLVEPFIKKMGDKMTYRVGLDDKQGSEKGKMAENWMEAAGQNGIPSAFLVDTKGRIAWIGHPMTLPEEVIREVLAGTFDVQKAAVRFQQEQQKEAELEMAWKEVDRAMKTKNWDSASEKVAEFAKLIPDEQQEGLDQIRMEILLGRKDYPAAYKLIAKMADSHKDQPMFQNQMAWKILTDESIEQRDLALAEKLAIRANNGAEGKDPAILDTLARAQFMLDKRSEAIATQEKAVGLAENDLKPTLVSNLESYRKGVLPKGD